MFVARAAGRTLGWRGKGPERGACAGIPAAGWAPAALANPPRVRIVIDYTTTDDLDPGDNYDFVLDAAGRRKRSKLK